MDAVWYALTPEMINDPSLAGLPQSGFIRLPAVLALIPVSKSTWWKGVSEGKFPKATKKFGPRIAAWDVRDIRPLVESDETVAKVG
jgi:predicted DNA-binding transcriptional regulator AlpA